jgi:FtsP/CotA-like multicopper oxidase with cupredoxin domain
MRGVFRGEEYHQSRVIARFDLPSGTETRRGQKFPYVFHCHILELEDNDMMRPYDVVG